MTKVKKCSIHGDDCPGDDGGMFMDGNHPDDMYGVHIMDEIMPRSGITIIDKTMRKNEIRILKSHAEVLGFNITNLTGKHLYVEPEYELNRVVRIILRHD